MPNKDLVSEAMQQPIGSNPRERIANLLNDLTEQFLSELDSTDFVEKFKAQLHQELDGLVRSLLGLRYEYEFRGGKKIKSLELTDNYGDNKLGKAIGQLAKKASAAYLEEMQTQIPPMSEEVKNAIIEAYNQEYLSTIYNAVAEQAQDRARDDAKLIIDEILGIKDQPLRKKRGY